MAEVAAAGARHLQRLGEPVDDRALVEPLGRPPQELEVVEDAVLQLARESVELHERLRRLDALAVRVPRRVVREEEGGHLQDGMRDQRGVRCGVTCEVRAVLALPSARACAMSPA